MNDVAKLRNTAHSGTADTIGVLQNGLEDISADMADLMTTMNELAEKAQEEPGGAILRTFNAGIGRIKEKVDGSVAFAMSRAALAETPPAPAAPKSHRPVDINALHELERKVNSLQDLLSALAFGYDDERSLRSAVQGIFDYNAGICTEVHQLAVEADQAEGPGETARPTGGAQQADKVLSRTSGT